jgi:hypothetical protein
MKKLLLLTITMLMTTGVAQAVMAPSVGFTIPMPNKGGKVVNLSTFKSGRQYTFTQNDILEVQTNSGSIGVTRSVTFNNNVFKQPGKPHPVGQGSYTVTDFKAIGTGQTVMTVNVNMDGQKTVETYTFLVKPANQN